ncbi:MAG: phosphatidylserine decarboxylase [Gammaproteobacteria bacterium]|nr:phosphatidylserine decarboxylase [Gammaproteobacteria bacterium]MCP5416930.1 phosphatidylserine decarboxylase [Chromatiaceae bacterium]
MSELNTNQDQPATLSDRLFALLLFLLPHHLLSSLMYALSRSEWLPLKRLLIRSVIRLYRVEMEIAQETDPEKYPSFNAFFTRALKPETRPIASARTAIVAPVDGAVSQAQSIENGMLFQAKGQHYALEELLGGERRWAKRFEQGSFVTIYLSPRDYHRIHMPFAGRLQKMIHVPGRLFSVNNACARVIPRLFSRNERVVNLFETEAGPMAVIMIGAIFVASMDTVWSGCVAPRSRSVTDWVYSGERPDSIALDKGMEMGRFNMGSTVIILFGKDAVRWNPRLQPGATVHMGEEIGTLEVSGSA